MPILPIKNVRYVAGLYHPTPLPPPPISGTRLRVDNLNKINIINNIQENKDANLLTKK